MKKLYPLFPFLVFFFITCEDKKEEDTTPPTVSITFSPIDYVSEIVSITCISTDNEGVKKVELWVNGVSTGVNDNSEPYSLDWNTTTYKDDSYVITVRSYDTSGNTTDSDPITLTVDNSGSYPQSVSITSITYTPTEMTITWNQSTDSDFHHYELIVSESVDGDKSSLVEVTEQNDTTSVLTDFDPSQPRWYWISVFDVYGYSTVGSSYYVLDDNPTSVELNLIGYSSGSFTITWSQSIDNDFQSYTLYESLSENMGSQTLIYETDEITNTTYVVTGIGEEELRYYQVVVEDVWGLQTVSNIRVGDSYDWFVNTFGGSSSDNGRSVQQTEDGGYVITGYTESSGNGGEDVWLIKTDVNGEEEWNQTFGGSENDRGYSVQQTEDGGFIITGFTDVGGYDFNVLLIKTDSNGNEEWNQTFGEGGDDKGYSVQQTTDGGYIIIGKTTSYNFNDGGVWLIKTDSQGNEEWNQRFGDSQYEEGYSVQQTEDNGYIIIGSTGSHGFVDSDVWLIKTDVNGEEEWNKTFEGWNNDWGYSVQQTTDGGHIITGETHSFGNGSGIVWLIKTDSQGNEEWNQIFGESDSDGGESVQQTDDDGYIIVGRTSSFGNGNSDIWLIKTDSQGNEEWNQTFGGNSEDWGYSVQQTTDGGYIITGITESFGNGGQDIILIKTDPQGNTVPESGWE